MESLSDYSYSGMDHDIKVCHILQNIKGSELVASVNIVWA